VTGEDVTTIHTLKMHFFFHWPGELMKWGQQCNMSTNICEILHKTTLKTAGKRTNQHSDMSRQVLQRSVERTMAFDACVASDMHHYTDGQEEDLWGDTSATR
jgi:hypothetical protein